MGPLVLGRALLRSKTLSNQELLGAVEFRNSFLLPRCLHSRWHRGANHPVCCLATARQFLRGHGCWHYTVGYFRSLNVRRWKFKNGISCDLASKYGYGSKLVKGPGNHRYWPCSALNIQDTTISIMGCMPMSLIELLRCSLC